MRKEKGGGGSSAGQRGSGENAERMAQGAVRAVKSMGEGFHSRGARGKGGLGCEGPAGGRGG